MIVKDLKEALQDIPDHMIVFYEDSERGNVLVSKVARESDMYYPELEVLVIGRKPR